MTSDFGNGNPQALDLFNIEASLYPQDGFTFLEDQTVTDASSKSRASQASFDSALPYFASLSSWPQRTDKFHWMACLKFRHRHFVMNFEQNQGATRTLCSRNTLGVRLENRHYRSVVAMSSKKRNREGQSLLPDSARNSSQSVDVETLGTPSSGTMPVPREAIVLTVS
jgi:hypothetical protein